MQSINSYQIVKLVNSCQIVKLVNSYQIVNLSMTSLVEVSVWPLAVVDEVLTKTSMIVVWRGLFLGLEESVPSPARLASWPWSPPCQSLGSLLFSATILSEPHASSTPAKVPFPCVALSPLVVATPWAPDLCIGHQLVPNWPSPFMYWHPRSLISLLDFSRATLVYRSFSSWFWGMIKLPSIGRSNGGRSGCICPFPLGFWGIVTLRSHWDQMSFWGSLRSLGMVIPTSLGLA